MSRHFEKILAHANLQLAPAVGAKPTEMLPIYRKFLKLEEHRLRLRHRAGGGGREICARRVDVIDILLQHVFAAATRGRKNTQGIALLALGGYGRRELNPFSDVDVMFLHNTGARGLGGETSEVVEQVLYFLWDIGFKVGHSTRTVKEAVQAANNDMVTKTALLESRWLAGDQTLAAKFRAQFRARCVSGYERDYIEMRMRDQQARHQKHGNNIYLQEPNLKSGCGGLRDYQNLLWMTYFHEGSLTTNHLVTKDWLSEADRRQIEAAYDFLLRTRTELHYLNQRATDVLHLNMQETIARDLNYPAERGVLASEKFMKDIFAHERNIFRVTERITAQFAAGYSTAKTRSLLGFLPRRRIVAQEKVGDFAISENQLELTEPDLFLRDPTALMRAMEIMQTRNLEPAPEMADLFGRKLGLVAWEFRYAKEPREIFRRMLSRKGEVARVLRLMHRLNFLGQYLPEFGQMTCLVQHEFFHRYTADEHTLVCIDKLDALVTTNDPKLLEYKTLFADLPTPFVLYLALLLHDSGKAVGARPHSEASAVFAQRVARRLQLSSSERKMLILLVDHHLTLSNTAQRRNLDDPRTITEFAAIVREKENLDALMLLTLADGMGTSAEGWSDWKETLVWQLYHRTAQFLQDKHAFRERIKSERATKEAEIKQQLDSDFSEEAEAQLEAMPDNYFRAFTPAEIVRHVQLFRRFYRAACFDDDPLAPVVEWQEQSGHTTLTLCTWDRKELLAKIAGAISVASLNILGADIYTRGDNLALDVFRVADVNGQPVRDPAEMRAVEKTLGAVLSPEEFDLEKRLSRTREQARQRPMQELHFEPKISIDNFGDPQFTLIEVQAADRIGLLYDLLRSFSANEIDIALARVNTERGAAVDTFYVTDRQSRSKVTPPPRLEHLQSDLRIAATKT